MSNLVVIGTQWGDEGKGKIVDLLTPAFEVVARYQGGHNAGHTVYVKGKKVVLHLIPSGILHPGKLCLIGNGVVISPMAFLDEMSGLEELGVQIEDNIALSKNAHLILPYHPLIEKVSEERLKNAKIGTTNRGIGPSYVDKMARSGIRVSDLLNPDVLRDKIGQNVEEKNISFVNAGLSPLDPEKIFDEFMGYAEKLEKYIKDISLILDKKFKEGKSVLFEGAQGTLLDVDHGTFPFVTSSSPTAGGVCTGLGIGPDKVHAVLGVTKAYTTRVGSGPFPTEIFGDEGETLREKGNEFGATTGRPRRCGWYDAVAGAYACRINGINKVVMTKPDVLDGFDEIKVCVGYRYKDTVLRDFPTEAWVLKKVKPEYRTVKGWKDPVCGVKDHEDLHTAFKDYIKMVEDLIEVKVAIVSTGVNRKDTILIENELHDIVAVNQVKAEL